MKSIIMVLPNEKLVREWVRTARDIAARTANGQSYTVFRRTVRAAGVSTEVWVAVMEHATDPTTKETIDAR